MHDDLGAQKAKNVVGPAPMKVYGCNMVHPRNQAKSVTVEWSSEEDSAETKKPSAVADGFLRLNYCRRSPNLPHGRPCSTIGPARLNFRVRDGNG